MSETQGTEWTPETLLRHVAKNGAPEKMHACVTANAALYIREGLDKLAKEINRPLTPDEAFGPQKEE